MTIRTCKQSDLPVILSAARAARTPLLIWGSPGVGKTAIVRQYAEQRGFACYVLILSVHEPADLSGIPVIKTGGRSYTMAAPEWVEEMNSAEGGAVLFLDELSCARPAMQAAALRVVLDRVVGDVPLRDHVQVVAAANPPQESADGWMMSKPLQNRFLHVKLVPTVEDWASWAVTQSSEHALVASFLQAKPDRLLQVPEEDSDQIQAWPSPRSWDAGARFFTEMSRLGLSDRVSSYQMSVGYAAAVEYSSWAANMDLPPAAEVLDHPEMILTLERMDRITSACLSALQHAANQSGQNPDSARNWAYKVWHMALVLMEHDHAAIAATVARHARRIWPGYIHKEIKYYETLKRLREVCGA